jgi:monothiol glutaredoxin
MLAAKKVVAKRATSTKAKNKKAAHAAAASPPASPHPAEEPAAPAAAPARLDESTRPVAVDEVNRGRDLLSAPPVRATRSTMPLTDSQRAELSQLVQSKPVVLFMKGNRRFPACGFSATVVGILDEHISSYETVDVLQDAAVRDGMKELSNWPTFPQLYVNGQFVGGCDIVKDMHASGELQTLLGGEAKAEPKAPRVTITAAAAKAFAEAAAEAEAGGEVLRLEIDAGFQADLHFAPEAPGDLQVTSCGVVLRVARASAGRADGITIDFVETPRGHAFKIDNPNEPPRVKPIGPSALKAMLDAGRVVLFDVRPDAERARASIAQAKKLDVAGQDELFALKRDAAVALHCHHGVRSRAAAEQLLREGFTNVYNLEGGIEAWSREVDPSVPRY